MEFIYTAINIDNNETHYGVIYAEDAVEAMHILRAAHKNYRLKIIDEVNGHVVNDGKLGVASKECHYNVAVNIDENGSIYWADLNSDLCRQWWEEDDLGPFIYNK